MKKLKLLMLITLPFFLCFYVEMNLLFAQSSKPNIIIFISDDQNQMDIGCYGNQDVHTPHMDELASEGMRFTSAFAASPCVLLPEVPCLPGYIRTGMVHR